MESRHRRGLECYNATMHAGLSHHRTPISDVKPSAPLVRYGVSACLLLITGACGAETSQWAHRAQNEPQAALAAYERSTRNQNSDVPRLRAVAAAILEQAARSEQPRVREMALRQLELAGTPPLPAWERLSRDAPPNVRAQAWAHLARSGDSKARAKLQALDASGCPEARAARLRALRASLAMDDLLDALESHYAVERIAAAEALAAHAPDATARHALAEAARVDPDPSVRARATRSLGRFGEAAANALRGRLDAEQPRVREAAMSALLRVDAGAAISTLQRLSRGAPEPEGIRAARHLLSYDLRHDLPPEIRRDTRRYLKRALDARETKLRSLAAVTLDGLPTAAWTVEVAQRRLETECEPSVRLALASALLDAPAFEARAREVLCDLIRHPGMPGLQAAVLLADQTHDEGATQRILRDLDAGSSARRRVSARATALQLGRPHRAREALRDSDVGVRLAAAGAILASKDR